MHAAHEDQLHTSGNRRATHEDQLHTSGSRRATHEDKPPYVRQQTHAAHEDKPPYVRQQTRAAHKGLADAIGIPGCMPSVRRRSFIVDRKTASGRSSVRPSPGSPSPQSVSVRCTPAARSPQAPAPSGTSLCWSGTDHTPYPRHPKTAQCYPDGADDPAAAIPYILYHISTENISPISCPPSITAISSTALPPPLTASRRR